MFVDQRTLNDLAEELRTALADLDVPAAVQPGEVRPEGPGELVLTVDDRTVVVLVTTRADLRPAQAKELPELGAGPVAPGAIPRDAGREADRDGNSDASRDARRDARSPGPAPAGAGVVFADRLSETARATLRERGWGWLDRRRGHLRLWVPGLRIDSTIAASGAAEPAATRIRDPFTEKGRDLALWLLLHPHEPASPRAISREIDVSAGQISNLLAALRAESLLRKDKTPLVPELFWALADHWKPRRHALASMPSMHDLAGATELQSRRWVVGDTRAAMAYGAPVAAGPDYPPDLYVPDQRSLQWLLNRSVVAPDFNQRVATVAVPPSPLVSEARFRQRRDGDAWPLVHPIVAALDLAVDQNRGREVLEQWQPDPALGTERVW